MKILIIGGYGNFGKRLTNSLAAHYSHELIIAGRTLSKAKNLQQVIKKKYDANVGVLALDVFSSDLKQIFSELAIDLVMNASGPFQYQSGEGSYSVARACIDATCHYVDLADDRKFVVEFTSTLHEKAKEKGLVLVSGASTVPALTDAVIRQYKQDFFNIESLSYGISPGNRTERGEGTIASILSYTGKAFSTLKNGKQVQIIGWQGLRRHDFGAPLGKRWMSNCEIPDLDLLPLEYPEINNIRFQAGLEVTLLHVGLWFLSWFPRFGIIKNLSRYSKVLTRMSEWFISWGSDSGGMFIELTGIGLDKQPKTVTWQLVAEHGVGPNVPTISAELMIQKIAQGKLVPGAMPCMGLLKLEEFFEVAARWKIYQKESV